MSAEAAAASLPPKSPSRPDVDPVPRRWIVSLSLAMLGLWLAALSPFQSLLPRQIETIARASGHPGDKNSLLAWATGLASIAAILACPLAGALSDRTISRLGRRRPWALGGAVVCAAALVAQSYQTGFAGLVLCWCLVQAAINAMYAALSATIADQVPVRQRGVVSALVGLPVPLGLILGTLLTTTVVRGTVPGYLLLAVLVVALQLPFLIWGRDPVLAAREPFVLRRFLAAFTFSPRAHPDFALVGAGRFAIQLGNAVGLLYLYYYLQDVLHRPDPAGSVLTLVIIYTLSAMAISVVVGHWSDRTGRRKPFVVGSSVMMAGAVLVFALGEDWTAAMLAGAVLGLGYGSYLAIDNALITEVLPDELSRGKDLGLISVANTGSQALAPAIAGPVVAVFGYSGLYVVTAVVILIGAALIQPVRSVR
jgi:MFS family permease